MVLGAEGVATRSTAWCCLLSLLLLASLSASVRAETLYVDIGDPGASDANMCTSGSRCVSIARAISLAVDTDVVRVVPSGVYHEYNLNFFGKAITVRGDQGPDNRTEIDAMQAGRHFIFNSTEPTTARLIDFTLYNGTADFGGSILVTELAKPHFDNIVFRDNTAAVSGGAVYIEKSVLPPDRRSSGNESPSARRASRSSDSDLGSSEDSAAEDALVARHSISSGGINLGTSVFFIRCQIFNNTATLGGGIYVGVDGRLDFQTGGSISHNTATNSGGGVFAALAYDVVIAFDVDVSYNTALIGGGLAVQDSSFNYLEFDVRVHHNTASIRGGGVYQLGGDGHALSCAFFANEAPSGGGIFLSSTNDFRTDTVQITDNIADVGGGGMYVQDAMADFRATFFSRNVAQQGGGLYVPRTAQLNSIVKMTTKTFFYDNIATNGDGGGAFIEGQIDPAVRLFAQGNKASACGGGAVLTDLSTSITFTDIRHNEASFGGGLCLRNNVDILMHTIDFTGNRANQTGAAVFCTGSRMEINSLEFTNNLALGINDDAIHCPADGCEVTDAVTEERSEDWCVDEPPGIDLILILVGVLAVVSTLALISVVVVKRESIFNGPTLRITSPEELERRLGATLEEEQPKRKGTVRFD